MSNKFYYQNRIINVGDLKMYQGVGGYGGGAVGVGTTTAAAIILPNTGANWALTALAAASLLIGLAITISSVARIVAKHTI